ncbi:MAG TPA: hypothetical protein VFS48_01075, partial [Solirubrobacterales bacterium]|nr:hypothetical protein [Solirubrobacterales bacterium]
PGMVLKIVTGLRPDPATGLLTATIHDLPQVAIGRIALTLAGGPRGLLAAPLACGPARGQARFVPYGGGPPVTSTAPVTIASALPGLACPGPLPFAPQLLLSATSNRAGKPTSFSTTLHRRGGEGLPARFDLTLPAGLSAALGAVEACPESLASSGACPPASRVGSARAEVGSGPVPAVLSGGVYVAGPYRRAPFSLVMAFGVKVGPFDLGTVAFRAMARIDGRTGRVTVATDRLPSVVEGVPIRFQTIAIALDRQGLVRNPTSCGPHSLDVALESHEGAIAASSTPYQVRGCKRLGFSPRLDAALLNRGQLRKHKQVGMRVSARFHPADTALRSLSLAMPPALKLHVDGLKEICSRPDARRGLCPLGSRIGTARARTPLLDESLAGSVYVVQPGDAGEPDIWVALAGGGIKLTVRGSTAPDHGRLLTKLSGLPDMPLSAFTMRLGGPGKNVLSFEASPCANGRPRRLGTELHVVGQNGARRLSTLLIATRSRCGAAPSR